MLYWHAWVNKVSNGKFKNYKKIVASFSGRESFTQMQMNTGPIPKNLIITLNLATVI